MVANREACRRTRAARQQLHNRVVTRVPCARKERYVRGTRQNARQELQKVRAAKSNRVRAKAAAEPRAAYADMATYNQPQVRREAKGA